MELSARRTPPRAISVRFRRGLGVLALVWVALIVPRLAAAESPVTNPVAALDKAVPESVDDLKAIQRRVTELTPEIDRSTVAVRVGRAQGSGVIVSKDGLVLTAAHVVGAPGRNVVLTLSDGREVEAISLGVDRNTDAGMIRISVKGDKDKGEEGKGDKIEWPFAEMADPAAIKAGGWCIATGHPNGYQKKRGSVVRLGRIITARKSVIQTDCTLVGGDSGGPLFDMQGKVVGIHSRIGVSTAWNFHVPAGAYRDQWDKLVNSETIDDAPGRGTAVLGVSGDDDPKGCRVTRVAEGLPADDAGIKEGDVITRFEGQEIKSFDALRTQVLRKKAGDEVKLEVLRDGKAIEIKATLAARE